MASLFEQDFKYTVRAQAIFKDLQGNLLPIYLELMEEGFSPREITVLVNTAATQTENEAVQEWQEANCHPQSSPSQPLPPLCEPIGTPQA